MKIYQIFIFGVLFTFISSTCASVNNIKSIKDCGELSQEEKDGGLTHCCFVQAGEDKGCSPVTDEMYDAYKKTKSTTVGGVTYKYECYLPYLKFGFLNLIFATLWI